MALVEQDGFIAARFLSAAAGALQNKWQSSSTACFNFHLGTRTMYFFASLRT